MMRPGIEPWFPGSLANTPIYIYIYMQNEYPKLPVIAYLVIQLKYYFIRALSVVVILVGNGIDNLSQILDETAFHFVLISLGKA